MSNIASPCIHKSCTSTTRGDPKREILSRDARVRVKRNFAYSQCHTKHIAKCVFQESDKLCEKQSDFYHLMRTIYRVSYTHYPPLLVLHLTANAISEFKSLFILLIDIHIWTLTSRRINSFNSSHTLTFQENARDQTALVPVLKGENVKTVHIPQSVY